jgi:hypothetical protein
MNRNTRRKHKLRVALAEARREVRILLNGGPAAEQLKAQYELRDQMERNIYERIWEGNFRTKDDELTGGLYSQMMGTPPLTLDKP